MNKLPLIRLQFYKKPPVDHDLNLEDVEDLVKQRMLVLKYFQAITQEFTRKKSISDITFGLDFNEMAKLFRLLSDHDTNKSKRSDIQKDIISHFFLLMVCSRYDDMRIWFIQNEIELFKYRFNMEVNNNQAAIDRFLQENNLILNQASAIEVKKILGHRSEETKNCSVYKINWLQVLEYLKDDEIYLENGWAFVFKDNLVNLVIEKFRENLSRGLAKCKLYMNELNSDSRVLKLMDRIHKMFVGESDKTKWSNIKSDEIILADQIKNIAPKSFAPCMKNIYIHLNKEHHLKHWGRIQFGLFLRGIGVPLEEALKFWRNCFQPKIDAAQFDKQYAYNIRYNYGQEGKRANYRPFSCKKIITNNPPNGVDDCHGCPLAHGDPSAVVKQLEVSMGNKPINPKLKDGILRYAKERDFEKSCSYYFRAVHGLEEEDVVEIKHPNQYFSQSRAILQNSEPPTK